MLCSVHWQIIRCGNNCCGNNTQCGLVALLSRTTVPQIYSAPRAQVLALQLLGQQAQYAASRYKK